MLSILASVLGSVFAIKLFTSTHIIDYLITLIAILIIFLANKKILTSPYYIFLNMFTGVSIGLIFTPVFFFILLYLTNTDLRYESFYLFISVALSVLVSYILRRAT